jgi:hypothetical protein
MVLKYRELKVKPPYYVEVYSLNDFGRFVCALERTPMPTFSLSLNSDQILAVQADIMDTRPIIYFVTNNTITQGQYLAYRISGGSEEIRIVDSVNNPSFVYSPIINIKKLPSSMSKMNARRSRKSGYTAIKLMDVYSLAKVAAYKSIYDEPPLPIFLFPKNESVDNNRPPNTPHTFIMGTTINLTETDSLSYFYYITTREEPKYSYLRFSSQSPEQPTFSNRIDEHGYIYLKIIKLVHAHPLIDLYD